MPDFFPPQVPIWIKLLFWLAMVLGGLSNAFVYSIVYELNRHKPEGVKDSYYFWYPGKMSRIFREYEQQFPAGRKTTWFKVWFLIAALSFVLWFFLSFWYGSLKNS
jgi:hypothetical protein